MELCFVFSVESTSLKTSYLNALASDYETLIRKHKCKFMSNIYSEIQVTLDQKLGSGDINYAIFSRVRKIAKSDYELRHVCISAQLFAWKDNLAHTGRIFMEFCIFSLFQILSIKVKFH
jgi:hypothetical protein